MSEWELICEAAVIWLTALITGIFVIDLVWSIF